MTFGIDALLQATLAKNGSRDAFRCGEETITYAQLDGRARAVAALLSELGVSRGDRVGIAMTKGVEMPIALHGIWMAGAAFVPMDPTAPPSRLAQVAQDCEIKVLISADRSKRLVAAITEHYPTTIVGTEIETMRCHQIPDAAPNDFTPAVNQPDDIAYVMFTSGSTGVPKGMVHTHGSGRAFAEMWAALYQLRADDVFFTTTPLHFDFSLADFFAGPIAGALTELVPEGVQNFPASIGALLEKSGATIWSTVPFALIQLTERGATEERNLSRLRWVLFGGEPMSPHAIAALRKIVPAQISNSYGPAEVNQVSEYTVPIDHPLDEPVPIGSPTPHATLLQDEDGVLLVSAPSMMRGYWRRPDLDANAFVERDGQRFYRTGDLVGMGADGLWRFGGRMDRQVKVRGHRVELDEVEHALAAHEAVSEAAAVLSADGMTLAGFATLHPAAKEIDAAALKSHVMGLLPPYAVPATVTILQDFQRTTTGKIDRRVLQESGR